MTGLSLRNLRYMRAFARTQTLAYSAVVGLMEWVLAADR